MSSIDYLCVFVASQISYKQTIRLTSERFSKWSCNRLNRRQFMRFALFELFQLTFSFQVSGKVAANGAENAEETAVEVRESISLPTVIGNLSSFLTL